MWRLKAPFSSWKAFGVFYANTVINRYIFKAFLGNLDDSMSSIGGLLALICSFFTFPPIFNFGIRQGWIKGKPLGEAAQEPVYESPSDREPPPAAPPPSSGIPVEVAKAYETFGLHPSCSDEQLDHARRQLVSKWHPDKLGDMAEEIKRFAGSKLAEVNAAYDTIQNYRAQYQNAAS